MGLNAVIDLICEIFTRAEFVAVMGFDGEGGQLRDLVTDATAAAFEVPEGIDELRRMLLRAKPDQASRLAGVRGSK